MEQIRRALLNDIPTIIDGAVFFAAGDDLIHVVLGLTCKGFKIVRIETPTGDLNPFDVLSPLEMGEAEFRVEAAIAAHEQSIWIVRSIFGERLAA